MYRTVFVCVLVLMSVSGVTALSTTLAETYAQQETMIVEIGGAVLQPITPDQIELKRNNVQVPFEYGVKRLGSSWFIWGVAPSSQNNYTLYVHDVATVSNGVVVFEDIADSFRVTNQSAVATIRPGIVRATDTVLEFTYTSYEDFPGTITAGGNEVAISPGENDIYVTLPESTPIGFMGVTVGAYTVPVYVGQSLGEGPAQNTTSEQNQTITEEFIFSVVPEQIDSLVVIDNLQSYTLSIHNPTADAIDNVVVVYDDSLLTAQPAFIPSIAPGTTVDVLLTPVESNQPIQEVIRISNGEISVDVPISIEYTGEEPPETAQLLCHEDLGGNDCLGSQTCDGETVTSLDYSQCCLGECLDGDGEQGIGVVIGWLIASIVLIVLIIIVARYLKTKSNGPRKNKMSKEAMPPPRKPTSS